MKKETKVINKMTKKIPKWEIELEIVLDDLFPKLNEKNIGTPSSNNRGTALVFYAKAIIMFRQQLKKERKELLTKIYQDIKANITAEELKKEYLK